MKKVFSCTFLSCFFFLAAPHIWSASVAIPKKKIQAHYKIEAIEQEFKQGESLPLIHKSENGFFVLLQTETDNHVILIPKLKEGSPVGIEKDGAIELLKSFKQTIDQSYLLFTPHDRIKIRKQNDEHLTLSISRNNKVMTFKLSRALFEIEGTEAAKTPETKHDKKDKALDKESILCFIQSGDSRGSGFLFQIGETIYCVTNQHVITEGEIEIKTLKGKVLTPTHYEIAEDRDLARIRLAEKSLMAFSRMREPLLEEKIKVYGDSQGRKRMMVLEGKVTGKGDNEVEIDADVVQGNSGGPIVALDESVIGVVYKAELPQANTKVEAGTQFEKPRRIGLSFGPDIPWKEIHLAKFQQGQKKLKKHTQFTTELSRILNEINQSSNALIFTEIIKDSYLKRWTEARNTEQKRYREASDTRSLYKIREERKQHNQFALKQHQDLSHILNSKIASTKNLKIYPYSSYTKEQIESIHASLELLRASNNLFIAAYNTAK